MKQPSQAQLKKWIQKWQKHLRLQDWTIIVRYARCGELGDGVVANCQPHSLTKTALIQHITMNDFEGNFGDDKYDVESNLVHELLHLHFAYLDDLSVTCEGPYLVALEQAIDCIKYALVTRKGI